MADEFVDFYEILELPIEAERSEVRKRISELYIEAQKNLDHRNFDKRVKSQQMFEMLLPQARYILLDDGRRHDYDRIVQGMRAPQSAAPAATIVPAPASSLGEARQKADGGLRPSSEAVAGRAPSIDALPDSASDPATAAREREELWNKWKSGLQSAMEREASKDKENERKTAVAPTSLADRIEAAETGSPQPQAAVNSVANPAARTGGDKTKAERPKVKFNFGGESDNTTAQGGAAAAPGAEEFVEEANGRLTTEQIEERRLNHRRAIIKEELQSTGIKGMSIGALAVAVPGFVAMIVFMITYYPAGKETTLSIKNSGVAWMLWIIVLGALCYIAAYYMSKSLRRKQGMQLQTMSYEELLRHTNKNI